MNFLFDRKTPVLAVPRLGALAVLCLSVSVPLMTGCGQKDAASGAAGMPPGGMAVQVQVVKTATIPDTAEYLSVMKSRHSANINPQVEGQITKIFVKSGDRVDAGRPLLQIDPLKQQATVSSQEAARVAQEANVQLAKVSYDRSKRLFEAGVVAKAEFDSAQSNYDAAVAQLKSLEEQVNTQKAELHYYGVRSPMNGIVGDIPVRIGDRVAVTTLLTTVAHSWRQEALTENFREVADLGKDLHDRLATFAVHAYDLLMPCHDARLDGRDSGRICDNPLRRHSRCIEA